EVPLPALSVNALHSLAFAPDGKTVFLAAYQNSVRQWDLATGKSIRDFQTKGFGSLGLALSPEGRTLAVLDGDQSIRLWETATGAERGCFVGHEGQVLGLVFSQDGRVLASSGVDRTVLLWDMTGRAGQPHRHLSAGRVQALEKELYGTDGAGAYRAMW